MPKKTLTFTAVAGLIADCENVPGKDVPTLLRRVRMFDSKELLPTIREENGRRTGALDLEGACAAYLFTELLDMGFDVALLRDLHQKMEKLAEMGSPQSIFESACDAVANGKQVFLTIELCHRSAPFRKWHHFKFDGHHEANERVVKAAEAHSAAEGIKVRTTTRVDLSALLVGFVSAFKEA